MSNNLVNFAFTDSQLSVVDNALGELEAQLPGLTALTAPQRRAIKRMGEQSESFCRQTLRVVEQNPQIVPPTVSIASAVADLRTIDQLRPRLVRLLRLAERASDTDAALGNDVMVAS